MLARNLSASLLSLGGMSISSVQIIRDSLFRSSCGTDASETLASVATPGNCTIGAKTAMYWYQKEGNNVSQDKVSYFTGAQIARRPDV